jgi:hypothetical protein
MVTLTKWTANVRTYVHTLLVTLTKWTAKYSLLLVTLTKWTAKYSLLLVTGRPLPKWTAVIVGDPYQMDSFLLVTLTK